MSTGRAKTAPLEAADLPDMAFQDIEFCRYVVAGDNNSDAFRKSRDVGHWSPNAIWVEASRLANSPKVLLWLTAARQACMGTAVVTRDNHLQQLERLREIAVTSGNVGAAVLAETTRGKVAGHHVERVEHVTNRHDPIDTLREVAKHSPEMAAAWAAENNIPWQADEGVTRH